MRKRFKQSDTPQATEKVLDVDASMQGTLSFNDPVNLRINGNFSGKLNTKGSLMVGERAAVTAEIVGEAITIAGKVVGNIKALREIKLISPAVVKGDIETPILSIAEGAVINGQISMGGKQAGGAAPKMLSLDEVARYLEIERELVTEWADNGRLPGVKDGNSWKFERELVDRWVSNEKIS